MPHGEMRRAPLTRRSAMATMLFGSALSGIALNGAGTVSGGAKPTLPGTFPWQRLLEELAVTAGPYQGSYRCAPGGPINWYFANIGLWFFVNSIPDSVRGYLDAYIRTMDPIRNSISDVAPDLVTPINPDSNDAYAGTLLRLAVRYARSTGDSVWWTANLPRLKRVAYSNLLTQIKPNGLVRAFQIPDPNGIGYLMDQCEAYAGLRDFGQFLLETNDPDATYYSTFAMNLGIAIHTLYDNVKALWNWCDVPCPPGNAWYPNLTAQIYPHLYDVHSADAPGDYARLYSGYTVLDAAAPDWPSQPQDLYPWLVVGYYAATRLNRGDLALEMLRMVRRYYLPGYFNTGHLLVSEIGYVVGIEQAAASISSSASCPDT